MLDLRHVLCTDRYPDLLPPSTQPSKAVFKHKRWNVDPQGGLLSIVVPVYPMPSELGALRNQLRTFGRYFDTSSVAEYIIASPTADVVNTIAYVQTVISETANLSTVQFRWDLLHHAERLHCNLPSFHQCSPAAGAFQIQQGSQLPVLPRDHHLQRMLVTFRV